MNARIPAIVLGGTGYVAGELLRLLASHPYLDLAAVASDSQPDEPVACAATEIALADGSCFAAGVVACTEGFASDGLGGCVAVLPDEVCAPGTMALAGETACREVAPCGEGPWGDTATDGATTYVDAAYPGMDSDGSATRPWTTIGHAVAAAARLRRSRSSAPTKNSRPMPATITSSCQTTWRPAPR